MREFLFFVLALFIKNHLVTLKMFSYRAADENGCLRRDASIGNNNTIDRFKSRKIDYFIKIFVRHIVVIFVSRDSYRKLNEIVIHTS